MVLEAAGKELIEGCQRGERDAFRELFERHKNKVYSIALRYAAMKPRPWTSRRRHFYSSSQVSTASAAIPASNPGSIGWWSTVASTSSRWEARRAA